MRTSESIENLSGALLLANVKLKNPVKESTADAGKFTYHYASLPAILDEVRPVLTANGISVLQETITTDLGIGVTTRLLHSSGEWIETGPLLMARSNSPQDNGSALTYARRYALTAALGLAADEDDDGAAANKRGPWGRGWAQTGHATSVAQAADWGAPASDGSALGEGAATTRTGDSHYLSKEDQSLLKTEYGGQAKVIMAYREKFGDRIRSLTDITYEMRDQMIGDGAHV